MSSALAAVPKPGAIDPAIVEQVLVKGDLRQLPPAQKVAYYTRVCETLGLNPHTQPLAYIVLNGREVLYAKKDATEQLRKLHGVSITSVTSQRVDDVFVVTAQALDRSGRSDAATGAVAIGTLKGEALANALMKAETKAKRRVTLSICGLGMLDETEVEQFQQTVVVEAPKLTEHVTLPEGAVRILKVEAKSFKGASWAEVTFVTSAGEERTLPTGADGKEAAVSLFEQLAQEGAPVWITTKVTPRSKKTVINQVLRQPPTDAELDAEIVAKEAEVL